MYFDVVDEGLNVCQLFNEVFVYKSLIKTICENRKKNYIIAIAKCQLNEGENRMNKSALLNSPFNVVEILPRRDKVMN